MGALDGRVAVVTGAGSGVGRCHAMALAAEGAAVVVNDLGDAADDTVAAIVDAGGRAVAHHGSVATWATGDELVATAREHFGDLHIVVNNAGITRDAMSFSMTEDQWDLVVDVHLKGHFVCTRAAGAYWREQAKEGVEAPRRLVHTTSESGLFGAAGQTNYGAAKGGIISMSLAFGRELGKYGVTTNVIAPRARTAMTANTASMAAPEDPDAFDVYDPANVSPFIAWLCTDDAADVTGQVFIVGGSGVWRMQQFQHLASLELTGERLSVAEISRRRGELFDAVDPGMPPFQAPKFG